MNNCAVYADISGTGYVGGLAGKGWAGYQYYTISNCAFYGTVSGGTSNGALVGYSGTHGNAGKVSITNSYYIDTFPGVGGQAKPIGTNTSQAKTAEQFASGEVAYLLQSGNTEQVWGQMSNTEGSLPVLTDNELYKVAEVGSGYSVSNIGDTNADGIVDVQDYQALINTILADDHEQIETADYDDIIRYDLDGDGYLDVLDAHLMNLVINGFATVDVYAVGDYDCNGKAFEEADLKAIRHAVENPEKLSTAEKYVCDINGDGRVDESDLAKLNAICGE